MWVAHWNYPGGPQAYFEKYSSAWYQVFGTTALLVLQLMTDGLMVRTFQFVVKKSHVKTSTLDLQMLHHMEQLSHDLVTLPPLASFTW